MTDPNLPNQPEDPNRGAPQPGNPATPPPYAAPGAPLPPPNPYAPAGATAQNQPNPYAPGPSPYAQPNTGYGRPAGPGSPVLSIISLITGILGVLISIFGGWGFLFSVAAVVLGFLGKRKEPAAKGMWLTGLILGFAGIALSLIWLIIYILIIVAATNSGSFSGTY